MEQKSQLMNSELEPFELEMIEEFNDITKWFNKLESLMTHSEGLNITEAEAVRIKSQHQFMSGYLSVLSDRIASSMKAKNIRP